MPISPPLRRALVALLGDARLAYVDVGARRGRAPRWAAALKHTSYVGFEADPEECARLAAGARPEHRYIAAMLGRTAGTATFRVTANPACASLLEPNLELLTRFVDLAPQFAVVSELPTAIVSLDACLASHGMARPDFLELDTQGSELDILCGGESTLRGSVLGIQVEVEFAPMYVGQALFAEVDAHLRSRDFELIDLSRYRARRAGVDTAVSTRGQLLWGHAIYLRRHATLPPDRAVRLGVIAALLDLPDLAHEIFVRVAEDSPKALHEGISRVLPLLNTIDSGDSAALEASKGRATWRD